MGQALYRKYRSRKLSELVGQEHITKTLEQAIASGRISHAYLFTGPRGVGKTSTARILAHAINGIPYDNEQAHLDIIEIDAASNNSVEDIRDLREKVYIAPTSGKYKVYIIDEVHMLSRAAFNAILKTLEEPPAHAVFILATTEAHKLPQTIISRTQRFIFRPIEPAKAVEHLRGIAKAEHIDIDDEALALLAAHGDGSFRDSISLLDQASGSGKKIDAQVVQSLLGMPPAAVITELANTLTAGLAASNALQTLYALYDQGYQAAAIAAQLGTAIRADIVAGTASTQPPLMQLLADLLEVPISHDPERYLEILILRAAAPAVAAPSMPIATTSGAVPQKKPVETVQPAPKPAPEPVPRTVKEPKEPAAKTAESAAEPPVVPAGDIKPIDEAQWSQLLYELKKQYNTLYGIVRMAHVQMNGDELQLTFAFAFHQKRVNESKNRQIISSIMEQLTGQRPRITCLLDPDLKRTKAAPAAATPAKTSASEAEPEALSAISNIFGGGELLNS
jgi:DNA polymerase-3 subunit gamma/tau